MNKEMDPEFIDKVVERFKAFADPTRIKILLCLMQNGQTNVTSLSEHLNVRQASMSKHLTILKQAGVIALKREGNQSFYSVEDESIEQLCELMCTGVTQHLLATGRVVGL